MGFFDIFKGNQYKEQLDSLRKQYDSCETQLKNTQTEYEKLKASVTPEMQTTIDLKKKILTLQSDLSLKYAELSNLDGKIHESEDKIASLQKDIVCLEDEILVQEFGLYTPKFDFANALEYKEALSEIRAEQKALIKNKQAVNGSTNWTVNESAAQGRKMITDTQKLLLRAFNSECDELIRKVKYTNFHAYLDKIQKSAETISKLGRVMDISITSKYLGLKKDELRLAFEYQCKKQQEKEEAKAARAEQREQAKLQKELDAERRKIEKEQTHYQTAYEKLKTQISQNPDDSELLKKKNDMEDHLSDIERALTDIDYREANMKAGYVYVISNIGSFGEDVYKIGMTRRLDPQERIDELGDASVPFRFDVHAMIFSDDAPALEAALHRAFEDRKLNMVNKRREFFHVTLDEIKEVIKKNFDKTVEFIDTPDAEQYRISIKMQQEQA